MYREWAGRAQEDTGTGAERKARLAGQEMTSGFQIATAGSS
jgi:hypothetical protein